MNVESESISISLRQHCKNFLERALSSKILVEATIRIFDHFEQGSGGLEHVRSSVSEDPMFRILNY